MESENQLILYKLKAETMKSKEVTGVFDITGTQASSRQESLLNMEP